MTEPAALGVFEGVECVVVRHAKENLVKCTLTGLEGRADLCFVSYPGEPFPPREALDLTVELALDAPPLSPADADVPLLLLDATWRLAPQLQRALAVLGVQPRRRSLPPGLRTAYPRRQTDCPDPDRGLASVEALVGAYLVTGRDPAGLLDHYRWADEFLAINRDWLDQGSR